MIFQVIKTKESIERVSAAEVAAVMTEPAEPGVTIDDFGGHETRRPSNDSAAVVSASHPNHRRGGEAIGAGPIYLAVSPRRGKSRHDICGSQEVDKVP